MAGFMTWRKFADIAVGVPFNEKGWGYTGWNCWTLVCCGYEDVLGIKLPTYLDDFVTTRNQIRLARLFRDGRAANWKQVEREEGAVACILRRRRPIHVGIAYGRSDILHCDFGALTVIEPERHMRIDGYWKPA